MTLTVRQPDAKRTLPRVTQDSKSKNENARRDRILTRDVVLVMTAALCYMSSNMIGTPLMPGYAGELGATGTVMGVVSGMMSIVSLFCRPIAGNLSDRVSKRLIVGIGSVLYLASSIWYAFATSPGSLIAARMVNGVAFACCSVCLATWMAMLLPIRHMGAGMGIYGTVNALAMAIGPAIGIEIRQLVGYRATFLLSAVLAVVMVAAVLLVCNGGAPPNRTNSTVAATDDPQRSRSLPRRVLGAVIEPHVLPLAMVFMLFVTPYYATQSFLVEYADARGFNVTVSLFFPIYAVALLVLRVTLRDLFDRKSFRFFFVACSICMLLALLGLDVMSNNWILAASAILTACGYGIMSSATQSQAVIIAGREHAGIANSTYYVGIDLGMTLGSLLGGFLYGNVGITWFYPIFMLSMPLAWVIYIASAHIIHPAHTR